MTNAQGNCRWAAVTVVASLMTLAAAIAGPAQTFTSLLSVDETEGANPYAGLIQATDGNFYRTSWISAATGSGTIFRITNSAELTTLYNFCSEEFSADGGNPLGGLVLVTDGNSYGTTISGANPLKPTRFSDSLGEQQDGFMIPNSLGSAPFRNPEIGVHLSACISRFNV